MKPEIGYMAYLEVKQIAYTKERKASKSWK